MASFRDRSLCAQKRAELLLQEMSVEEKLCALQSEMIVRRDRPRDYRVGNVRNVGHFLHTEGERTPAETVRAINEDIQKSIEASPHGIPVLQNGEALHGAQYLSGTCFPQAIALAASFDEKLVEEVAHAVGKELHAGGIRQVFAPVVNLVRDCRWGRTEESYGEDVCLVSRIGAAYCRGLEGENIVATPKHFADNYADGGRDSNESHSSERELREVYLEPFRICFTKGGARGVMMAYNALNGVPCTCNQWLMRDILRTEWGFRGITVSDYGGTDGVYYAHRMAENKTEAQALCLKAGLNVDLPNGYKCLPDALERGMITEKDIDSALLPLLRIKFELGLFEDPFGNEKQAEETVRCDSHRALARKAAEKSMVLLKNKGLLPLKKEKYRRIGVFGPSADTVNVGGYSGPYGGWNGAAKTPLEVLRSALGETVELIVGASDEQCISLAPTCDLVLYFTATMEGEGADRCRLTLPNTKCNPLRNEGSSIIVDKTDREITVDQEKTLAALSKLNVPLCVVLINGAPVDVSGWIDGTDAVLEAWYPGEEGADAICDTLLGINNPGGRLPITFPREVGQVPLYYSRKPTGRSFAYVENDGSPRFPFGFGLSYTSFEWSDFKVKSADTRGAQVTVKVKNTGAYEGDEVVCLYLSQTGAEVVRPMKELKTFQRVTLAPQESREISLTLTEEDLSFYDRQMHFGIRKCKNRLILGTDCTDERFVFDF